MAGQGILLLGWSLPALFRPRLPCVGLGLYLFLFSFPFFFFSFSISAPLATFPGFSAANHWFTSLTLAKVSHAMT